MDNPISAFFAAVGALGMIVPVFIGFLAVMRKRRRERGEPAATTEARLNAIRAKAREESPLDPPADDASGTPGAPPPPR